MDDVEAAVQAMPPDIISSAVQAWRPLILRYIKIYGT